MWIKYCACLEEKVIVCLGGGVDRTMYNAHRVAPGRMIWSNHSKILLTWVWRNNPFLEVSYHSLSSLPLSQTCTLLFTFFLYMLRPNGCCRVLGLVWGKNSRVAFVKSNLCNPNIHTGTHTGASRTDAYVSFWHRAWLAELSQSWIELCVGLSLSSPASALAFGTLQPVEIESK